MNTNILRKDIDRILYDIFGRRDVHFLVDDDNEIYLSKRFEDTCVGCDKAIQDGNVGSAWHNDFVHDCGEENMPESVRDTIKQNDEQYLRDLVSDLLAELDASLNDEKLYSLTTSLVSIASMSTKARSRDLAIRKMVKAIKKRQGRYAKLTLASPDDAQLEIIIDFDIDEIQARVIGEDE